MSSASASSQARLSVPVARIDQQRRADLDDDALGARPFAAHGRHPRAGARLRRRHRPWPSRAHRLDLGARARAAPPSRPRRSRPRRRAAPRPRAFFSARSLLLQLVLGRRASTLFSATISRLLREPGAIGLELAAHDLDRPPPRRRACASTRCSSTAHALDMAEEAVAEPGALMRAFDQAGNVGEHELGAVDRAPRRDWDAAW